jgi:YbbR domain-containing protein
MVLALLLPPTVAPADVLHVYDRLNRLRATVDTTANDSSIWTYDAVGNVLTITRHPATQTTILELPAEAVAGACGVRILGIGFSATPSQNTVTVNGVAATVQSATATELVVCLGGAPRRARSW